MPATKEQSKSLFWALLGWIMWDWSLWTLWDIAPCRTMIAISVSAPYLLPPSSPSLCKGWVKCCPDSMNNISPFFSNYCPFCSFLRSLFTSKRYFQGLQAFISMYIFMAILIGRAGELIYFIDQMKGAYESSLCSIVQGVRQLERRVLWDCHWISCRSWKVGVAV